LKSEKVWKCTIMTATGRNQIYGFEEFCTLLPAKQKADLISGVIYLAAPEAIRTSDLSCWLLSLMFGFVQQKNLGAICYSRVAFRLGDYDGPEPDIAFIRKERLQLCRRNYFDGPPDLAIEVVSPESEHRDYKLKRRQYEIGRIPEYLIVDEMEKKLVLLRLNRTRYREVKDAGTVVSCNALPGFWLRPAWLWQDPLPLITDVLAEIAG
jgi:Uma2 family endonuclease